MIELSFDVRIDRSAQQVFEVLTDFEAYLARWAAGPVAATRTSAGATGVGSRFVVTAKVGPFRVQSPYEVLTWAPPSRFIGRGIAGPVRFEEEYRLSEVAGATELSQSIRAWPRAAFRVIEPLIERKLRSLITSDLERLGALVLDVNPQ